MGQPTRTVHPRQARRGGARREFVAEIGGEVGAMAGPEATGVAGQLHVGAGLVDVEVLRGLLAEAVKPRGGFPVSEAEWVRQVRGQMGAGATVETVIDMGGPNGGRYWEIVSIALLGSDDRTSIAGTNVTFCIGSPDNPALGDIILPGATGATGSLVPASAQFGSRQCVALSPDRAYFKVYGVAATQSLTAVVLAWDRPVAGDPERTLGGPVGAITHLRG